MTEQKNKTIAIIGAGMAGLSCAVRLQELGYHVELFEKGRGPAGRMSTKRGDDWTADHGAQYFTARDPLFIQQVTKWIAEQVVAPWNPALSVFESSVWRTSESKDIRYVGVPGMNAPAKQLAKNLTIHAGQTIDALTRRDGKWFMHSAESGDIATGFDSMILAIPGPQAFNLVRNLDDKASAIAQQSNMKGCWTIMARFTENIDVPFDAAFVNQEVLSWVSRNLSKPKRTGRETWTLHANAEWSQEFIELSKEEVTNKLLACAKKIGLDCSKAEVSTHRWRYASGSANPASIFYLNDEAQLGLCGDWLNGGRVEGAWLSGYKLAEKFSV